MNVFFARPRSAEPCMFFFAGHLRKIIFAFLHLQNTLGSRECFFRRRLRKIFFRIFLTRRIPPTSRCMIFFAPQARSRIPKGGTEMIFAPQARKMLRKPRLGDSTRCALSSSRSQEVLAKRRRACKSTAQPHLQQCVSRADRPRRPTARPTLTATHSNLCRCAAPLASLPPVKLRLQATPENLALFRRP